MTIETPTATYARYNGNGSTTQFTFSFTKFEDDDVVVYLFNSSSGNFDLNSSYAISGSTITFNTAPPAGTGNVLIFRRTDFNASKVPNFNPGSSIRGEDLDKNFLQSLRVDQEFRDLKVDKYDPEVWADLDLNSNRVRELADATLDTDAVNRKQLGNVIASDITGVTAQGISLTKTQSGSNSGDEMVVSILDSSPSQKGSVIITPASGEAINVGYNSGTATIGVDRSSPSQQGVVTISQASNEAVNVVYTADGETTIGVDKSTANQQGVVRVQQVANEAVNVAYTTDGEVSVGVDKSTSTQQGVVKIQSTTPVTTTYTADGEVTLSIADGSVDLAKIKPEDIRTLAEQNTTPNAAGSDDEIGTTSANDKRYDIIYQSGTPSATDFVTGKLWYDHANDQTLYVWDGSNWLGISSGGTFVTQPTVIWVDSVNGIDTNDGHRVIDPMKTIKAAVASADAGDIVLVTPGIYRETAPIDITVNNLSIVGQSLRSCFIHPTPATEENSLFRVNSGTQIQNFSFGGLKASGTRGGHAIDSDNNYGLPTNQAFVCEFYPNAVIYKSPYIQNCTNFADSGIFNHTQAEFNADNSLGGFFDPNNVTQGGFGGDLTSGPTGGGLLVDGSAVSSTSPLRSMVVDSFTQVTLDGPGILCCNNGYAQLVSFFGTFCHYHAKALNGGQLNLSNCTTDYGRYGLIADGKSPTPNFTAPVSTNASAGDITFTIGAQTAGSGWYGSATRPQDNMSVTIGANTYPVKSAVANGSGWDVTIENPNPAALATNLGLIAGLAANDVASFFNRSYISTGGHTFEYVGAGTDYRAAPENGGVPIEANQVKNLNNGKVFQSSTDHNGKFKVGETFTVDQRTGEVVISLDAYRPELVNDLSPQLGGDLDVNGQNITGTVKLNGVTYPSADGATDQVLKTDGSGNLSFVGVSSLSGAGMQNLSDDTTPQLGGNFDVVTYDIVSTSNRDIDLDPNGSGSVVVKGNATRGSGNITLNCENNSHGVKLKGPPHSAGATYTLTLPNDTGTSGQALTTNGSGVLSFTTIAFDAAFIETPQAISTNKVIAANTNAGMMGPTVSINSGVTISVGANSQLTVLN